MIKRLVIAAAIAASAVINAAPAHAGPMEWCNPSSPTFDPYVCFGEQPGGALPLVCDPNVNGYDPYYCAASQGSDSR